MMVSSQRKNREREGESNFSIQLFTSAGLLANTRGENWISKGDPMLSARTLFRRCCSRPGENSVRRMCDRRSRRAAEIPRQSFYSSSRSDVMLLSTQFGTVGSLVQGTTCRESKTRTEEKRTIYLPSPAPLRETKIRFLVCYMTNLQTAFFADHRRAHFPGY